MLNDDCLDAQLMSSLEDEPLAWISSTEEDHSRTFDQASSQRLPFDTICFNQLARQARQSLVGGSGQQRTNNLLPLEPRHRLWQSARRCQKLLCLELEQGLRPRPSRHLLFVGMLLGVHGDFCTRGHGGGNGRGPGLEKGLCVQLLLSQIVARSQSAKYLFHGQLAGLFESPSPKASIHRRVASTPSHDAFQASTAGCHGAKRCRLALETEKK
mmetsp:Transcript_53718/g.114659  ORF Transcript_53718/g.114659 Transcript_53718/m.114659 type:complete len:213 (-) Transcript_53718:22-660(-)